MGTATVPEGEVHASGEEQAARNEGVRSKTPYLYCMSVPRSTTQSQRAPDPPFVWPLLTTLALGLGIVAQHGKQRVGGDKKVRVAQSTRKMNIDTITCVHTKCRVGGHPRQQKLNHPAPTDAKKKTETTGPGRRRGEQGTHVACGLCLFPYSVMLRVLRFLVFLHFFVCHFAVFYATGQSLERNK
jgi:hypothetical protein